MEDGGADTTVIERRQHKMGRMADLTFFWLLQFFNFVNMIPKWPIKSRQQTLFECQT